MCRRTMIDDPSCLADRVPTCCYVRQACAASKKQGGSGVQAPPFANVQRWDDHTAPTCCHVKLTRGGAQAYPFLKNGRSILSDTQIADVLVLQASMHGFTEVGGAPPICKHIMLTGRSAGSGTQAHRVVTCCYLSHVRGVIQRGGERTPSQPRIYDYGKPCTRGLTEAGGGGGGGPPFVCRHMMIGRSVPCGRQSVHMQASEARMPSFEEARGLRAAQSPPLSHV